MKHVGTDALQDEVAKCQTGREEGFIGMETPPLRSDMQLSNISSMFPDEMEGFDVVGLTTKRWQGVKCNLHEAEVEPQ